MKLNEPKVVTFWIAVILGVLGILGKFVIAALDPYAFWLVVAGLVVLILGNLFKGI